MSWAAFSLDTLVDEWGKTYQVFKGSNDGDYDDLGIFQSPEAEWENDFGVLAVMTNNVLMPNELGAYTSQDLYCITRSNYEVGNWIKDGERKYKVHERADFSFFDQTDLRIYKIKLDGGRLDNSDE